MEKTPEEIREELKDYYGTAAASGFPMAVAELSEVDELSEEELEELRERLGL